MVVLEVFSLMFISAAIVRGRHFHLRLFLEPLVKYYFHRRFANENNISSGGFIKQPPMEITFPLVAFLTNRQWKRHFYWWFLKITASGNAIFTSGFLNKIASENDIFTGRFLN